MAATYRRVNMKALARYQIILLGEQRHIGVNNLPKVVAWQCIMQRPGIEPTICWSWVQRPNHYTTEPPDESHVDTGTVVCNWSSSCQWLKPPLLCCDLAECCGTCRLELYTVSQTVLTADVYCLSVIAADCDLISRALGLERYQERHPISSTQYWPLAIPVPIPILILVYSIATTTKNPKTLWWWQWLLLIKSSVSAWCPNDCVCQSTSHKRN